MYYALLAVMISDHLYEHISIIFAYLYWITFNMSNSTLYEFKYILSISFVIKSNLKSSIIYPTYLVISCHTKERPTQYLIQIESPLLLLEPETFFVTCVTFPKWNINLSNNLHGSFHITSINPLRKMLNATVAKIVIRL